MVIVYPLLNQIDYTELKYSLRSLTFIQQMEVVIVGEKVPDWINNVTQICVPDIRGKKQLSIRSKILAALNYSAEILFLNDDIFFLKEVKEFPYYYHSYLKHYTEQGTKPLENQLKAQGKPTKHFDGHFPIIYKQDFKEVSKHFTGDCIIKSMYCNYLEIEGVFIPDCKIVRQLAAKENEKFIEDRFCFSTGMSSLKSCIPLLEKLYPKKSKFEL